MADRNGYNPSILQDDQSRCYICGNRPEQLVRHEVFGASNRSKSKAWGLWVAICPEPCHRLAHGDRYYMTMLHKRGQMAAMATYRWTREDFINEIGRNYL